MTAAAREPQRVGAAPTGTRPCSRRLGPVLLALGGFALRCWHIPPSVDVASCGSTISWHCGYACGLALGGLDHCLSRTVEDKGLDFRRELWCDPYSTQQPAERPWTPVPPLRGAVHGVPPDER